MRRQIQLLAVLAVGLLAIAGCSDAYDAKGNAMGKPHTITVYSGGQAVRVFHSTGMIENESQSDGWYFKDRDSGRLVRVTGTIVVEADQ